MQVDEKKEEQFRTELVDFYLMYVKELNEVHQKEIEMSAGEAIGEEGIKTAMYHSYLNIALKQASDLVKTIEYVRKWRK